VETNLTDSEAARCILAHSMQSEGSPYYDFSGGVAIVLSSKKSTQMLVFEVYCSCNKGDSSMTISAVFV
jgi:hypothetical protein